MKIYDTSLFEKEASKRYIDFILIILLDIILLGVGLCLIISDNNKIISLIFLILGILSIIFTIIYVIIKIKDEKELQKSTYGKILHDIETKEIKDILTNLGLDITKVDCRLLKRESVLSVGYAYDDYTYAELLMTKNYYYFSIEPMEDYFYLLNNNSNEVKDLVGSDNKLSYEEINNIDIYKSWVNFINDNTHNAIIVSDYLKEHSKK